MKLAGSSYSFWFVILLKMFFVSPFSNATASSSSVKLKKGVASVFFNVSNHHNEICLACWCIFSLEVFKKSPSAFLQLVQTLLHSLCQLFLLPVQMCSLFLILMQAVKRLNCVASRGVRSLFSEIPRKAHEREMMASAVFSPLKWNETGSRTCCSS